jgi:2,3-bisphosphoglycerate-independent phosphoglycerate mutase
MPAPTKFIYLVADGMGDWPLDELGGATPLGAANTPVMDALAGRGLVGACRTIPENMPPGSDVANMALLGYDPEQHHTGRGPIEAMAQGLSPAADDLVWRCNLVDLTDYGPDGTMLDYSAGHIDTETAASFILDLEASFGSPEFTLYPGVQYRHLLVQRDGAKTPAAELDINPPHDITDRPIAEDVARYDSYAPLGELVRASAQRLDTDANPTRARAIWPWGQGKPLAMPSFFETFGRRGAVVSAVDTIRGLGRATGLQVLIVEGATGLVDTNYAGKAQAAMDFLERGDFVFVHLEGPDESGHGGNAQEKITGIERFDAQIVAPLYERFGSEAAFLVTCDHFTPIAVRTHTKDPVPFLLTWPGCETPSRIARFTEETAAGTGVVIQPGHKLLPWALDRVAMGS